MRIQNTKLRAEIKLNSKEIKDLRDNKHVKDLYQGEASKITSRLDSIDGKCKEFVYSKKKQYSDIIVKVRESKEVNPDNSTVVPIPDKL